MENEHIAGSGAIVAWMTTGSVTLFADFGHGAFSPSVDCRGARGRILTVAAFACCALQMIGPAIAADGFKRLNAAEIRGRIVGKVVTDGAHWSDRFEPDGTFKGIELGVPKPGTWKFQGNEICVTRHAKIPRAECFEIWLFKDEVEYRRDGITLTSGVRRNE